MDLKKCEECSKEIRKIILKYFEKDPLPNLLEFFLVDLARYFGMFIKDNNFSEKEKEEMMVGFSRTFYLSIKNMVEYYNENDPIYQDAPKND